MSLTCDGLNDYLVNTTAAVMVANFSIYVRAKVDITTKVSVPFVSSRSSDNKGWNFKAEQWNNTGRVGFTLWGIGDYTSNINTPVGWEGYVVTFGGDPENRTVTWYVGSSVDSARIGALITTPSLNGFTVGCGHRNGASFEYFLGDIAEVAIWGGIILSQQQAQLLINSGIRYMPLQIWAWALKAYWTLDRDAIDRSGNGNDGTLNDGTWKSEGGLSYP